MNRGLAMLHLVVRRESAGTAGAYAGRLFPNNASGTEPESPRIASAGNALFIKARRVL